jgi:hypothetical protein
MLNIRVRAGTSKSEAGRNCGSGFIITMMLNAAPVPIFAITDGKQQSRVICMGKFHEKLICIKKHCSRAGATTAGNLAKTESGSEIDVRHKMKQLFLVSLPLTFIISAIIKPN